MNAKKIMKNLAGLSTGLAVTVAFFNVALLITELVKTVTDDGIDPLDDEIVSLNSEDLKEAEWMAAEDM